MAEACSEREKKNDVDLLVRQFTRTRERQAVDIYVYPGSKKNREDEYSPAQQSEISFSFSRERGNFCCEGGVKYDFLAPPVIKRE